MKTMKFTRILILIALFIGAIAILAILGGVSDGFVDKKCVGTIPVDGCNETDVPEHYIPPEYWANALPATPIPESGMITIILSETTLTSSGQDAPSGIVEIPLSLLNLSSRFMKSNEYENWYTETSLDAGKSVILLRMPQTMYERHIADSQDNVMSLPVSYFCRFYDNLTVLNTHMKWKGDVLTILPG